MDTSFALGFDGPLLIGEVFQPQCGLLRMIVIRTCQRSRGSASLADAEDSNGEVALGSVSLSMGGVSLADAEVSMMRQRWEVPVCR